MKCCIKKCAKKFWKKLKKLHLLIKILILIIIIFLILFISWIFYLESFPEKKVYFNDSFDQGLTDWKGIDMSLELKNPKHDKKDKMVKLLAKEYLAPHIYYDLPSSKAPPATFVYHFEVKVSSYTDEAVTLSALIFPTDPTAIVSRKDGTLGSSHSLFAKPTYSTLSSKLKKDTWQDIYIYFDISKHNYTIYIDDKKVLTNEYKGSTYPLQKIWLGTLWVKGGGSYGSASDICYDNISLGNKGLLEKASFPHYLLNLWHSLFSYIKNIG